MTDFAWLAQRGLSLIYVAVTSCLTRRTCFNDVVRLSQSWARQRVQATLQVSPLSAIPSPCKPLSIVSVRLIVNNVADVEQTTSRFLLPRAQGQWGRSIGMAGLVGCWLSSKQHTRIRQAHYQTRTHTYFLGSLCSMSPRLPTSRLWWTRPPWGVTPRSSLRSVCTGITGLGLTARVLRSSHWKVGQLLPNLAEAWNQEYCDTKTNPHL